MSKTKIIVVAGPTASGKTGLAVEIARAVSGEVISADSMQVYKGISIASADFMTRNTLRRVEVATPIYDPDLKLRVEEMFLTMLSDNVKAREEGCDGKYRPITDGDTPLNSQEYFYAMAYAGNGEGI